ncbi:hypothetical protein I6A60_36555 [Frankia sp. AgB1.9]|uniref:effector-associated domain EAD1-containing protein n=1 Tax=unclassified Frankia TaxID=2632575 RepID=UPI001931EC91|nr:MULTISPECIES: effector-associated domain EAD1-containing protein [unclassified Frankia]MBL7488154.1 hypothetical protein [Frankia sp. AgW1.1]MBL7553324.1 hypothetical protein [Frankia sp. AgB1.9]MBL7620157.1 hypothetical protein [Frankia sp. AgB1.8]
MERLSEVEIRELARRFADAGSATHLLAATGWSAELRPSWQARNAFEFWQEVAADLEHGAVRDGRRRLLTAAAARYPDSEVFAAGWEATRPFRAVPSRDLLPVVPAHFVARAADAAAGHEAHERRERS